MSTICQCNKEKKSNTHLRVIEASWNIALLLSYLRNTVFPPLPFLRRLNRAGGFGAWRLNLAFSPRVKVARFRRSAGGRGGLGSSLPGFSPNTGISFLMISPKLLDICPIFLLVFSPIKTADLLILFQPWGDGNSLLCSQKSIFRGTSEMSCT